MKFKELSYKRPKGAANGNGKKSGGKNTGKNVPGSSERVQKTSGEGSKNTGDGGG